MKILEFFFKCSPVCRDPGFVFEMNLLIRLFLVNFEEFLNLFLLYHMLTLILRVDQGRADELAVLSVDDDVGTVRSDQSLRIDYLNLKDLNMILNLLL